MKYEAAKLKDISKVLGLSVSTISRALNDSYEISEKTKKLVREYAEKINYRPNPVAVSLREKRSRSIGVIIAEIANSFFSQMINGVESVAHAKGYNVIITQSLESYERELSNLEFLASRSVDGCLISVSTETKNFDHITRLHKRGFPFVCFDRIIDDIKTHKVSIDNFKGAYDATKELVKSGFKRIAMLGNAEHLSITQERLSGYKAALADAGLVFDESLIRYCLHGGMIYGEVEQAMNELMSLRKKPDTFFAASDKLTTNFVRYCKAKKISIPNKLGLVGFSNLDLTDLLTPALSVIRQPAFEMGEAAAELLIKLIEAKRPPADFENMVLPPELLIRGSSERKK
ncbi:LacI family DNA-binding transcriptional regulator [Parafilimonas terrae]|uniref:Transcriptional regulator, LacI family n=1 Tax=Parafilimonas terrae TaxID=1465490 RepID=A0A1I5TQ85_9BACT|nr:LacI family DNA-binding transcriptional regulator [Parafilimonas terrae]SFP85224.1 transcriptional regulator, LacI family [Parafilimonas terrae]